MPLLRIGVAHMGGKRARGGRATGLPGGVAGDLSVQRVRFGGGALTPTPSGPRVLYISGPYSHPDPVHGIPKNILQVYDALAEEVSTGAAD